jgi:conjugal transfer pilus assembly protein TraF
MNVRLWVALAAFASVLVVSSILPRASAQQPPAAPAQPSEARSWWDDSPWVGDARAFLYYPDPKQPAPKKKVEPPRAKALTDIKTVDEFRKELDRLRDVAIMTPSEDNIRAYLYGNKLMMDRASLFTDQWRRVVWKTPELEFNQHYPQANAATLEAKRLADAQRGKSLATIGKSFSLLYFFRSDCALCRIQSPALAMFSKEYGIEVQGISMDGVIPPDLPLPSPRVDNGISYVVTGGEGVNTVPALFLVSHDRKQVDPLGVGVIAVEEIAERIRVVRTTTLGEDYIKGRQRQ